MKRRFLGIPLFIIIIAIVAVLVIGGTAMAFFAWNGTAYIQASTATITLTQGGLDGNGFVFNASNIIPGWVSTPHAGYYLVNNSGHDLHVWFTFEQTGSAALAGALHLTMAAQGNGGPPLNAPWFFPGYGVLAGQPDSPTYTMAAGTTWGWEGWLEFPDDGTDQSALQGSTAGLIIHVHAATF
jgi:hypothetical protein